MNTTAAAILTADYTIRTSIYSPEVREVHPKGYPAPFWAGATRREGLARVTDLCRHQHETREAAEVCAEALAAKRNGRPAAV